MRLVMLFLLLTSCEQPTEIWVDGKEIHLKEHCPVAVYENINGYEKYKCYE